MTNIDPLPRHSARSLRRVVAASVVALLAVYAVLAFLGQRMKGVSYDEGEEIAIGWDIWLNGDFRMESANGDFVKRWATLPYFLLHPRFPSKTSYNWLHGEPYLLGFQFLFQSGNRPEALLHHARVMIILLGIAAGLLVFACSRELFGDLGGLFSLAFFVFSPDMLAFGGLVSTEISVCLSLLGSTWCVWRLLHRVTWGRLIASLVFCALLVLSKPTALCLFPISAILVGAKLASGRPLEWALGAVRSIRSRRAQAGIFLALAALHIAAAWATVWAHYDFRYAANPEPNNPKVLMRHNEHPDSVEPAIVAFIAWSRRVHFLPEGYLRGINGLLKSNDERPAFMDGQWRYGGWRMFFPYAMWAKTSPALPLLLLLGAAGWVWLRRQGRGPPVYDAIPYATLVVVYLVIAIGQNIDIGFRHILPVYTALFVLAGCLGPAAAAFGFRFMVPAAALMVGYAGGALWVYPNFMAYFSPLVGGPMQGYKRLVDSSLDWGQDMPGLRRWFERHPIEAHRPIFLAYFGTGSPEYYNIRFHWLPCNPDWHPHGLVFPRPGVYVISATLLQGVGTSTFGPWNRVYESEYQRFLLRLNEFKALARDPAIVRGPMEKIRDRKGVRDFERFEELAFGRLCAWLRNNREPNAEVGHSILIWNLDAATLRKAYLGPPAELADGPVQVESDDGG